MPRSCALLLLPILFFACTSTPEGDPCTRFFQPYPDLNPQRVRTERNAGYVDGMAYYNAQDHKAAIPALKEYVAQRASDKSAYLYLACSYLALGEPYDAELQLDHLERSNLAQFSDQAEWYTLLCWVCSGQTKRAIAGARAMVASNAHTYKRQAEDLLKELEAQPQQ